MGSWIHDGFLDSRWILGFLEPLRQRFQNFGPTGIHNWFQQVLSTMGGGGGKEQKNHAHLFNRKENSKHKGPYMHRMIFAVLVAFVLKL